MGVELENEVVGEEVTFADAEDGGLVWGFENGLELEAGEPEVVGEVVFLSSTLRWCLRWSMEMAWSTREVKVSARPTVAIASLTSVLSPW